LSPGPPHPLFRQALDSGDLRRVRALAGEMPSIHLADAARILGLIRRDEPASFDRAAVRWMARYATERARGVEDLGAAVDALDMMREDPGAAATLGALVG
jgi:hypothetical protein